MSKIRVAYAHGVDVCMPWEMIEVASWYEFADWLKQENEAHGPVSIIYWEYTPSYAEEDHA
jgi:hypothetical protein